MSTVLYYFSGTGNSLYIAKELAAALGAETRAIAHSSSIDPAFDTVGIVFPIYFGGLPRMVVDFLEQSAVEGDRYVFAVATNGGAPGHALFQFEKLLAQKGAPLSAGFIVRLPGNYLVKYGAFPKLIQNWMLKGGPAKLKKIVAAVQNHEVKPLKKGFMTNSFVGYYDEIIGKIAGQDQDFHIDAHCTNCGTCERVCPRQNILLQDGKRTWQHNCEHCMACIQWCPVEAIQYGEKTKQRKHYRNPYITLKEMLLR